MDQARFPDCVKLLDHLGLYLRDHAKVRILVISEMGEPLVDVNSWEVMEKLHKLAEPERFTHIRLQKSPALEFLLFEGLFQDREIMSYVIRNTNNTKFKAQGSNVILTVKIKEDAYDYPTVDEWETYFKTINGKKNWSECIPGERADTVIIKNLPTKWFSLDSNNPKPCERFLKDALAVYGTIRKVDYEDCVEDGELGDDITALGNQFGIPLTFNAYIQYQNYAHFKAAMAGLKGKQLMRLFPGQKPTFSPFVVDYDRTGFMTDKTHKMRKLERERLAEEAKRKHEAYMRQQNELMKQQIEKRQRKKRKLEEKKMEESRRRSSKGPKKKKKKSGIDKSEIKQIESLEDECKQVAAKLLKGILIKVAAVERERLLKQREDVLKRYSEHKKRQEEEQKMVEEDKAKNVEAMRAREKELKDRLMKKFKQFEEKKQKTHDKIQKKKHIII